MSARNRLTLGITLLLVAGIASCGSQPDTTSSSGDDRPTVSFSKHEPHDTSRPSVGHDASSASKEPTVTGPVPAADAQEAAEPSDQRTDPFFSTDQDSDALYWQYGIDEPKETLTSSEDCLRPRRAAPRTPSGLDFYTAEELAEAYPVMHLAIEGKLQEAYAKDPTLDINEDVYPSLLNPLTWSIEMHCYELFDWLVDKGALEDDLQARFRNPGPTFLIDRALNDDNTHALSVLLMHSPDLDLDGHAADGADGTFPAFTIARSVEALQLLLDAGADPNPDDFGSMIDWYASGGNAHLVEHVYPLSDNPSTAIFRAVNHSRPSRFDSPEMPAWRLERHLETLRVLRRLGADISYPVPSNPLSSLRDVTDVVEWAKKFGDDRNPGVDPAVIAFLEEWAAE